MGTPAYMSPEQARGEQHGLDRRSDVYGLGATLYELLGGAPPFSDRPASVLLAVLRDEPRPLRALAPSVPEDLETISARCLAKEPGRRYDSARALADDLDRYLRGDPILARKASLGERLWRRARRHRALVGTVGVSLAAPGVVGGLARLQARRQAADLEERARRSDVLTRAPGGRRAWPARPWRCSSQRSRRTRPMVARISRCSRTRGRWPVQLAERRMTQRCA